MRTEEKSETKEDGNLPFQVVASRTTWGGILYGRLPIDMMYGASLEKRNGEEGRKKGELPCELNKN